MHQTFATLVSEQKTQKCGKWLLKLICFCSHAAADDATDHFTLFPALSTPDQWIYNCRQTRAIMRKRIRYRPPQQSISAEWNIDHTASVHCALETWPQAAVWSVFCPQSHLDHCRLVITAHKSLYRCSLCRPALFKSAAHFSVLPSRSCRDSHPLLFFVLLDKSLICCVCFQHAQIITHGELM